MTDAELDALDAFLAQKVMGWRLANRDDGRLDWYDEIGPTRPAKRVLGGAFSPTRSASDAEEVEEKWLRVAGPPAGRRIEVYFGGFNWYAGVVDGGNWVYSNPTDSPRLAKLLAIARACGWEG